MATAKTAVVTRTETISTETRLLELVPREPLAFVGGQYVIVHTPLVLPNGKAVKRAYSLVSADAEPDRVELVVKRIPNGPGSGFVHGLEAPVEVSFSGPWGKFFASDGASGPTLVIGTDTGVTAALGLVQGSAFARLLPMTTFVWLRVEGEPFLSDARVRARLPAGCRDVRMEPIAAVDDPERIVQARALLARLLARTDYAQAFVAGDGAVNYALLDDLVAAGVPATRDHLESFFNMPKKSS